MVSYKFKNITIRNGKKKYSGSSITITNNYLLVDRKGGGYSRWYGKIPLTFNDKNKTIRVSGNVIIFKSSKEYDNFKKKTIKLLGHKIKGKKTSKSKQRRSTRRRSTRRRRRSRKLGYGTYMSDGMLLSDNSFSDMNSPLDRALNA